MPRRLRLLDLGDERGLHRLGAGAVGAQAVGLGGELVEAAAHCVAAGCHPSQLALAAFHRVAERAQFAADLGCRGCRPRSGVAGGRERLLETPALGDERFVLRREQLGLRGDQVQRGFHLAELVAQAGGVGFEVGDDAGVEQLAVIALERALALGEDANNRTNEDAGKKKKKKKTVWLKVALEATAGPPRREACSATVAS